MPLLTRSFVLVTLIVTLSACTGWRAQTEPPAMVIQGGQPDRVRLHLDDSRTVVLEEPYLVGDSVAGIEERVTRNSQVRARIAFPVTSVSSVDVRGVSPTRTGILVFGAIAAIVLLAQAATSGWSLCNPEVRTCRDLSFQPPGPR